MGFNPGKDNLTGLEVDSDSDIKLDASTGNVIFQDNGTDIVTLDMDTVATQAVFTHNVDNNAALLCFKQANGVANAGSLDGGGTGGWFSFKRIEGALDAALDLSSINDALIYTGGVVTIEQDNGAFAITLPTATNAPTAAQLLGWNCRFIINTAGSDDITIVRGDTGNDIILGLVASCAGDSAAAAGITVGSNVVTFVDDVAVAGDFVDIVCTFASASITKFVVSGMAST